MGVAVVVVVVVVAAVVFVVDVVVVVVTVELLVVLRGTIIIRTFDQHKNLYITVFLLTVFGPDYYVPR